MAETAITTFAEKYLVEYEKGGRLPGQGPRRITDLLRLPGRALGSPAHVQPDRERVRHGAAPNRPDQGRVVPGHRPAHGVQARHGRRQDMAQAERRDRLPKVVQGVTFRNGVEVTNTPAQNAT